MSGWADLEDEVRDAVAASRTYVDVLRRLGLRPAGGNAGTLKRWINRWGISTEHFDPRANHPPPHRPPKPLHEVMVECSTYSRQLLKRRLFKEGLKQPVCEECGQGEIWRGARMALILDHINGVATDHRLENLRIVCPNCAATLDTHCGKHKNRGLADRTCATCGKVFRPANRVVRHCSLSCSGYSPASQEAQVARRKVERPPYEQLLEEIERFGYSATGRRYGVSDNAIRKWVRWYEQERAGRRSDESRAA